MQDLPEVQGSALGHGHFAGNLLMRAKPKASPIRVYLLGWENLQSSIENIVGIGRGKASQLSSTHALEIFGHRFYYELSLINLDLSHI